MPPLPSTRREFLRQGARGAGLLAFGAWAPEFLTTTVRAGAPRPEADRRVLVLVQLAGGNDGLNTIIPYEDDRYHRLRPRLAVPEADRIVLPGGFAMPTAAAPLADLHREGLLGIVRNVGYPNPNRSHFRSTEIWETATPEDYAATGWAGRYLDHACAGSPADDVAAGPLGVAVSDQMPLTLANDTGRAVFAIQPRGGRRAPEQELLESVLEADAGAEVHPGPDGNAGYLRHTLLDAIVSERRIEEILRRDRPETAYPGNRLAQSLQRVAALIAARQPTRVYFVSQGGYDTHVGQAAAHARLLGELSGALAAFQRDLAARGLADQVLTMTFSEFGRRAAENGSQGTDHGTAAPLFLLGTALRRPVEGNAPELPADPRQDLRHETDFRRVYATVLERWLDCPSEPVLGDRFEPLGMV